MGTYRIMTDFERVWVQKWVQWFGVNRVIQWNPPSAVTANWKAVNYWNQAERMAPFSALRNGREPLLHPYRTHDLCPVNLCPTRNLSTGRIASLVDRKVICANEEAILPHFNELTIRLSSATIHEQVDSYDKLESSDAGSNATSAISSASPIRHTGIVDTILQWRLQVAHRWPAYRPALG
jgi:hypothetical protein